MSLFLACVSVGLLLLSVGLWHLWNGPVVERWDKLLPRSLPAAIVLLGAGGAWFLWRVTRLGPSDFGDYKNLLFAIFAGVGLGSFFWVRDFLAVRGGAVLVLLAAGPLLDSAYMLYHLPQRLVLVVGVYLAIAAALYLGTVPFRLRDFLDWLFARPGRVRGLGALCAAYGLALLGVALSLPR